jgi:hypothetical protein
LICTFCIINGIKSLPVAPKEEGEQTVMDTGSLGLKQTWACCLKEETTQTMLQMHASGECLGVRGEQRRTALRASCAVNPKNPKNPLT